MKGQSEGCFGKRKSLWKVMEGFSKGFGSFLTFPHNVRATSEPATKNLLALNMTCHLQSTMIDKVAFIPQVRRYECYIISQI